MISIRKMNEDDIPSVAAMEQQIFTDPWSENVYRQTLKLDGVTYLVATDDEQEEKNNAAESKSNNVRYEKIVAACGIRNIVGDGEITNVMVLPEYRNCGLGYTMVSKLLEEGRMLGVINFTLEVRSSNMAAISLYEKLGFAAEGIRKNFYDHPKEDAVIMWKR